MSSKKDQERVHSKPVPRFYKMVSLILKEYCNRNCSLRTVMYEANVKNSDFKKYFATLSKIVSRYTAIESALRTVKLFEEQPRFDHHLAFVLASEMYTKDEDLVGNCKPISVLNSYGAKLRQVLKIAIEEQDKKKPNKESALNSRFVRINTLLCHETDVKKSLNALDWRFVEWDEGTSYDHFLQAVKNLGQWDYMKDFHVPNLFVFPPKQEFWQTDLYNESHIILQDKASCLPAFISGVKPGDTVIDSCAAPGNKTSHLADLMANEGRLIAVDKDAKRFETLEKLLSHRGITCVETLNQDFRSVDPSDYADATVILVDPSCSSSGTSVHEDELSKERVLRLASFQLQVLSHALSFPSVKTVVYSTCSVNEEENEAVVMKALSQFSSFHLEDLRGALPGWKHFGLEKYDFGALCLRTNPSVDLCQGFFVAKFVKDRIKSKKRKKSKKEGEKKEKKIKK